MSPKKAAKKKRAKKKATPPFAVPMPSAGDPAEELADWVEIQAVLSPEKRCSLESLARVLHRNGTTEGLADEGAPDDGADDEGEGTGDDDSERSYPDVDPGSEISQRKAGEAFAEIETRVTACGAGYPFVLDEPNVVRLAHDPSKSDYVFMLLLTSDTPSQGHEGTAALFESLCVEATRGYLGGSANRAQAYRFGSPRKVPYALLFQALDDLCKRLGEGIECKQKYKARHVGDDQLDIVGWRSFLDPPEGKLILFGQCCAGRGLMSSKWTSLPAGGDFSRKWLREDPAVPPLRSFFVPWRLARDEWRDRCIGAGIVFDRCRIVSCIAKVDEEIEEARAAAVASFLKRAKENPS